MEATTRAQRVALMEVYNRVPLNYRLQPRQRGERTITYREFRRWCRKAGSGLDYCVVVPWCGMLLGIESDGHTHSYS
jgi:hypothetical protein